MDNSADTLAEIGAEMRKLGFAGDMYVIEKADPIRFMNVPEGAVEAGSMAEVLPRNNNGTTTIMPGGLLTYKTSAGINYVMNGYDLSIMPEGAITV